MQKNNIKENQMNIAIKDGTILRKMSDLGICGIKDIGDKSLRIFLESPSVPLAKFFDTVSYIWPEIHIGYSDVNFPYQITLSVSEDDTSELIRDFTDTSDLKFFYNPEKVDITSEFLDSILREWFIFVHSRFMYIGRKDVEESKIPRNWPHDISFHRVGKSIKKSASDIFMNLDWNMFNYSRSEYASIILKTDLMNGMYFSDELLDEISNNDITIRHIIEKIKISKDRK